MMFGSLSDTLIVLIVAILLLGGEKNLAGTLKNLGKTLGELKRRQDEFKRELTRELSGLGEVTEETKTTLASTSSQVTPAVRPMARRQTEVSSQDKVREIEEQIKRLQAELERLKLGDGKN
jgi:hypothetical protein